MGRDWNPHPLLMGMKQPLWKSLPVAQTEQDYHVTQQVTRTETHRKGLKTHTQTNPSSSGVAFSRKKEPRYRYVLYVDASQTLS